MPEQDSHVVVPDNPEADIADVAPGNASPASTRVSPQDRDELIKKGIALINELL